MHSALLPPSRTDQILPLCNFGVHISPERFYGTYCGKSLFFICHKDSRNHFDYTFIPQSKTWSDAREYCRDNYDDLATIEDSSDLNSAVKQQDFPVWTGLHRDGKDRHGMLL